VLQGLRETYNSLTVPVGPVVISIGALKDVVKARVEAAGIANSSFVDEPFDHMIRELGETNV
jgi:phycobilisome core component